MRTLLAAWGLLVACSEPANTVEERPKPVVRVGGAPSMMDALIPSLTETHHSTRGTLQFEVGRSSSTEGLRALLDGELDLAASTRLPAPSEEELAKALGWSFDDDGVRHVVGVDVTTVIVHPDASLESLTYDQVIGIFCTRTIDDWSFLGQEAKPLVALTPELDTGDRALFEDFFCGPRGIHPSLRTASRAELAEAMASDPSAITFLSSSQGVGKPVPLQPDPSGPSVAPTQQHILSGAYPLYRDVYLFTAGPAAGYTRSMLDWIRSPAGQEVVDEKGFVPLFIRPGRLDEPRPLRETVHFDSGKSVPNQRSMARLKLLVDEIRQRKPEHVILEGFTDDREAEPAQLSENRARAVRELLKSELPELFFEVVARGPDRALTSNDTPYGRLRNRRVQVYLADGKALPEVVVDKDSAKGGG